MEGPSEQLLKWEPFPGLPRSLDTPSLMNDFENGFRLILAEPSENGRAFKVGSSSLSRSVPPTKAIV